MNHLTRLFLVLLRLAIGWLFLVEGVEKIRSTDLVGPTASSRPWSSQAYLRESTGPFAEYFRRIAGDPDREALELLSVRPLQPGEDPARVPPRRRISPALDKAWNEYFETFKDRFELTDEQEKLARAKLDQAKDQAVRWLSGQTGTREIEKSFGPSATIHIKESPQLRISVYRQKVEQLDEVLNKKLPAFGRDVEREKIAALKADLNRMRTELLADLERPMQESLTSMLDDNQKRASLRKQEPVAGEERTYLKWADAATRYGLTAVGACLLLGLFTRTACIGGACFLILFYMAMPALPWLPENPRSEGHYLFINKNMIMMLALLALATTRSGRWAGLDGLLYIMAPWCWRHGKRLPPASVNGESPASSK